MEFLRPGLTRLSAATAVLCALSFSQPVLANKQLELVPDDTLFYFGTGKPIAVEDLFALLPGLDGKTLEGLLAEAGPVDADMLNSVVEFLRDPKAVAGKWGLGEELEFSGYTVGVMPVLRVSADTAKFEETFQQATSESDITFDTMTHRGIEVRITPLGDDSDNESDATRGSSLADIESEIQHLNTLLSGVEQDNQTAAALLEAANAKLDSAKTQNDANGIALAATEIAEAAAVVSSSSTRQSELEKQLARLTNQKEQKLKMQSGDKTGPGLITAAVDNELVFAIASDAYDPAVLDQLLGLSKPEESLQQSGKVKEIRSDWGYGDEMMMYLDINLLADAVTGGGSLAARQIQSLSSAEDEIGEFSTDPCRAEVRQFARSMPMIVGGYRKWNTSDTDIDFDAHMAMVLKNDAVLDTLRLMRGAVPVSQSSSEAMFSMGLGIDVDTTPQLAASLTDLLQGIDYQCEVLTPLNRLAGTDISTMSMGAAMVSGMARGITGISFNLYDGEVDTSASIPVKGIDSAIAIAAENPASLLQTLRILPQMAMLGDIPLDGTPISLNDVIPVPLPDDAEFFAAVKDKSIVIYSGEQAADFANRLSSDDNEGFFFTTINTRKLLDKADQVIDQLPQGGNNELDTISGFMDSYPAGKLSYKIDFTDKGVEVESAGVFERTSVDE